VMSVDGRVAVESVRELLSPARAALILIDVQNDYVTRDGVLDRCGFDISALTPIVEVIQRVLDAARRAGVRILYVQDTRLPDGSSDSPAVLRFVTQKAGLPRELTVRGTWGWQVADAVAPQANDIVIEKFREGAFVGTPLDLTLRSNGIETVVIVGAVTQGCVESTARGAYHHDYYVVLVRDALGSYSQELHDAAMTVMERKFDLVDSAALCETWSTRLAPSTHEDVSEGAR
jgi:ureidoacrylate peracid hydrolase